VLKNQNAYFENGLPSINEEMVPHPLKEPGVFESVEGLDEVCE